MFPRSWHIYIYIYIHTCLRMFPTSWKRMQIHMLPILGSVCVYVCFPNLGIICKYTCYQDIGNICIYICIEKALIGTCLYNSLENTWFVTGFAGARKVLVWLLCLLWLLFVCCLFVLTCWEGPGSPQNASIQTNLSCWEGLRPSQRVIIFVYLLFERDLVPLNK